MKRTIDGNVYDTTESILVASHTSGSTHVHRVESLYRSPAGAYFLVEEREVHGVDGVLLTPFSAPMARQWLTERSLADRMPDQAD